MIRIAHISDTHFGTEEAAVCAALRADLLRDPPDLLVLTGDITQRARRAQFRAARAFLDSLVPIPVLSLPGNHDLPLFDLFTRFTQAYRHYKHYICPTLAPVWTSPEVAVVGANSTRVLRHKHGVLSSALIQEVARRLTTLPQPFKVVALHHPLAVIAPGNQRDCVRAANEALVAWTRAGADLFLGGHIHLPYCISAGSKERQALILQAGTAVSTRRRKGQSNSFNLVRFESGSGRRIYIEQRDYDPQEDRFASISAREAAPCGGGWGLHPASR